MAKQSKLKTESDWDSRTDHFDGRPKTNTIAIKDIADPLLHRLVIQHGREKEYRPWAKLYLARLAKTT